MGPLRPWRRLGSETVCRCRIFEVERARFEPAGGGPEREAYTIAAPDWITIVPVTPDRHVVLVRQYRFGTGEITLETPGGMCDGAEDPEQTARRELLEETGYEAGEIFRLGWVHPNPAIQSNRCHAFAAWNVRRSGPARPGAGEEIEVTAVPLERIPHLIGEGAIRHSLVLAAFHLLSLRGFS